MNVHVTHASPGDALQNVLILVLLITKQTAHWLHGSLKATVPCSAGLAQVHIKF